jgi:hypothetical protein
MVAASEVLNEFCQTTSAYQTCTTRATPSAVHNNRRPAPTSRRPCRSPTAFSLEPARSIVFTGNGPNGLEISKETTHVIVRWPRVV